MSTELRPDDPGEPMQRDWTDPRDGAHWLVTLSPFGVRSPGEEGARRLTISFHRPGRQPHWTGYGLEKPVSQATDQQMMDLLDAALRSGARDGRAPDGPASAPLSPSA